MVRGIYDERNCTIRQILIRKAVSKVSVKVIPTKFARPKDRYLESFPRPMAVLLPKRCLQTAYSTFVKYRG